MCGFWFWVCFVTLGESVHGRQVGLDDLALEKEPIMGRPSCSFFKGYISLHRKVS